MEWISVDSRTPELKDDCVLAYFQETGSIETVHIEDNFRLITAGIGLNGEQLYTRWYISAGITHWMPLPEPPKD